MQALKGVDLMTARSHLIKLSIILEDVDLHIHFLKHGGKDMLIQFLHQSLMAEIEPCLSVMSSIVKTLLFIAHVNPKLEKELSVDNTLLLNVIRYLIFHHTNQQLK